MVKVGIVMVFSGYASAGGQSGSPDTGAASGISPPKTAKARVRVRVAAGDSLLPGRMQGQ